MSDYEKMWKKLGINLQQHEELLESMMSSYENIIASQKNRPKAMAYFDDAVGKSHCRRVKELIDWQSQG